MTNAKAKTRKKQPTQAQLRKGRKRAIEPQLTDRPSLTKREAQVAIGIGQGRTYPDIGNVLGLKYETVRSYVNKLRDKTGRRSKSLLVLWAHDQQAWLQEQLADKTKDE